MLTQAGAPDNIDAWIGIGIVYHTKYSSMHTHTYHDGDELTHIQNLLAKSPRTECVLSAIRALRVYTEMLETDLLVASQLFGCLPDIY